MPLYFQNYRMSNKKSESGKRIVSSDEDESQSKDVGFQSPYNFRPRKKSKETTRFQNSPISKKGTLIFSWYAKKLEDYNKQ